MPLRSFRTVLGALVSKALAALVIGVSASVAAAFQAGLYFEESALLRASDGQAGDLFGAAVDVQGTTLVVGAPGDDDLGPDAGAAYVFERIGDTWTEVVKLLASDGATGDEFGVSVSVHEDTIAVGAYLHDAGATDAGAAYVFVRQGSTWVEQAALLASAPAAAAHFGFDVSNFGAKVVVGSPGDDVVGDRSGSATLFERTGTAWYSLEYLTPSDGQAFDLFGTSVSIWGPRLVVGAPTVVGGFASGAPGAYVFVRAGTDWIEHQKLTQTFGDNFSGFGWAVAMREDRLMIGAPFDLNGRGYVFLRGSDDVWTYDFIAQFTSYGICCDRYGASVDIEGDFAVGGAWSYGPADSGITYLHQRHANWWGWVARLRANDSEFDDELGISVAIDGPTIVSGAWQTDSLGEDSGSVYVHEDVPIDIATPYCFGDGSAGPCPCGNETPLGNGDGCANSVSGNGASLFATGTNSLSENFINFFCRADAMSSSLLFMGTENPAGPVPFGGGLLCLSAPFTRLQVVSGSAGGLAAWYWHQDLQAIGGWGAGDTVQFQVWYRVPPGLNPCGAEFSTSNALAVTFMP